LRRVLIAKRDDLGADAMFCEFGLIAASHNDEVEMSSCIIALGALIAYASIGASAGGSGGPPARQVPSADSLPFAVSAPCKAPSHMKQALKRLLDDLDGIARQHEEVTDTDVREQMYVAIHKRFIVPEAGYIVPPTFGMFSRRGDRSVREAIVKFLADPEVALASMACQTPQERLDWFQDIDMRSSTGKAYDEYFGYSEKP
jgi:hypothetical protein